MNGWMNRQLTLKANSLVQLVFTTVILALCVSGQAFAKSADDGKLRIIVFGAHPDDCDTLLPSYNCAVPMSLTWSPPIPF